MELIGRFNGLELDRRVHIQGYRLALRLCRIVLGLSAAVSCKNHGRPRTSTTLQAPLSDLRRLAEDASLATIDSSSGRSWREVGSAGIAADVLGSMATCVPGCPLAD